MRETSIIWARKARSRQRLAERYYVKQAILETWEERPTFSSIAMKKLAPDFDVDYTEDLRKRIRAHQNDLAYRGVDGFTELSTALNHDD